MNRGEFAAEIYDFIWFLTQNEVGPRILDCGGGGKYPKMAILHKYGYDVEGIDNDQDSINAAEKFAHEHSLHLKLKKADIRALPFESSIFDGVYSYSTIFHMTKKDIAKAVQEILRVLTPGGIGYIQFIGPLDLIHRTNNEQEPGEFLSTSEGYESIHTICTSEECEKMLQGMKILELQSNLTDTTRNGRSCRYHFLNYYFQKPRS